MDAKLLSIACEETDYFEWRAKEAARERACDTSRPYLLLSFASPFVCRSRVTSYEACWQATVPVKTSEFTEQDGRKKRTAKRLYVTNVTGLMLACYVVIFT